LLQIGNAAGRNSTIDDSMPSSENLTALYCRDVSPNSRMKCGFDCTSSVCREACRLRSARLNAAAYARSGASSTTVSRA